MSARVEYACVERYTRQSDLMYRAAALRVSPAFAVEIVRLVFADRDRLPPLLRFGKVRRARTTLEEGRLTGIDFDGNDTVETVLHECAHALAGAEAGHDRSFVVQLDVLLRDYVERCEAWVNGNKAVLVREVARF